MIPPVESPLVCSSWSNSTPVPSARLTADKSPGATPVTSSVPIPWNIKLTQLITLKGFCSAEFNGAPRCGIFDRRGPDSGIYASLRQAGQAVYSAFAQLKKQKSIDIYVHLNIRSDFPELFKINSENQLLTDVLSFSSLS